VYTFSNLQTRKASTEQNIGEKSSHEKDSSRVIIRIGARKERRKGQRKKERKLSPKGERKEEKQEMACDGHSPRMDRTGRDKDRPKRTNGLCDRESKGERMEMYLVSSIEERKKHNPFSSEVERRQALEHHKTTGHVE
jgi:hypothetical protein